MKWRGFFFSFKVKLLVLITFAILLPLLAAGLSLGHILQKRLYASFENELQVASETMDLLLARWEEETSNELGRLADDHELESRLSPGAEMPAAADSILKEKITAQRKILGVGWLALFDINRQLLASSKFKSKNLALDFSVIENFQIGKHDSSYYLIFITPVKQRGAILGYLAGGSRMNDSKIARYLQEKKLKEFAFWFDGNLMLSDMSAPVSSPPQDGLGDFKVHGESYHGLTLSREYGKHVLQYAVLVPVTQLQRDLRKLQGLILAIIGALFLVFFALLTIFANHMTRPLHQLTMHAQQLAAHQFALPGDAALARLAGRARDEVGRLAESFLQMERQLQNYLGELAASTRANEKIQSELRIARHIQMSMLPDLTPDLQRGNPVALAAAMEPAEQVGGDFYDFFMLDPHNLCLVIGDVSDKGLPAALFMAMAKTLLRAVATLVQTRAQSNLQPHEILTQANRELCRDNDLYLFVTIFLGILNVQTGELQYSCGGHHPPFLFSGARGVLALNHQQSSPLGWKPAARYTSARLTVRPGEGLFLYTDGVTEMMNAAGELFSQDRLQGYLREYQDASPAELTQRILTASKDFSSDTPMHDDITVLALRFQPAEARDSQPSP